MYTPGPGISSDVVNAIKPVYADLTKAEILKECLHGRTQNPNESFNSTIWERAQIIVCCGLDTLELALYDAIANYDYGRTATLDIYEHLKMNPGEYTVSTMQLIIIRPWPKSDAMYYVEKRRKKLTKMF